MIIIILIVIIITSTPAQLLVIFQFPTRNKKAFSNELVSGLYTAEESII